MWRISSLLFCSVVLTVFGTSRTEVDWANSYECLSRFTGISEVLAFSNRSLGDFLSILCYANNDYVECLNSTIKDRSNALRDVLTGLCDRHTLANLTEQQECLSKLSNQTSVNLCTTLFTTAIRKEYQRQESITPSNATVPMDPYCELVDEFLTCTQDPIRQACGPDASAVLKRILLELADRMFSGKCGLLRGGCFYGKLVYKALNDDYFRPTESFGSVRTSSHAHCARVCHRNPFCVSARFSPVQNSPDDQWGSCELSYTQQNCKDTKLGPMEAFNHPSVVACMKCEVL